MKNKVLLSVGTSGKLLFLRRCLNIGTPLETINFHLFQMENESFKVFQYLKQYAFYVPFLLQDLLVILVILLMPAEPYFFNYKTEVPFQNNPK